MKRLLLLAWRYVLYHQAKTIILTFCLTLTVLLPLAAHLLITHYGRSLLARAEATPLLVGARGNRFDLVLAALYFGGSEVGPLPLSEAHAIRDTGLGTPIPLHLRFTARGRPIVGTTLDYFDFRDLRVSAGTLPLQLGQAVLGAEVAEALDLAPGDHLFSDQRSLYDLSRSYPLKMPVVGVLAGTGTADDHAVFVDVKTAWVIEGLTHGHQDVVRRADPNVILDRTADNVTTNASIFEYNEITPKNLDTFHTHADPEALPVSAIIVVPNDRKSATLLKARYNVSETRCMLVPADVVRDLMALAFRIKRFFDANYALISISTVMFLALVILLSHRLRRREMETMFRIGAGRRVVFWLQAAELGIVVVFGLVLACGLAWLAVLTAPQVARLL